MHPDASGLPHAVDTRADEGFGKIGPDAVLRDAWYGMKGSMMAGLSSRHMTDVSQAPTTTNGYHGFTTLGRTLTLG